MKDKLSKLINHRNDIVEEFVKSLSNEEIDNIFDELEIHGDLFYYFYYDSKSDTKRKFRKLTSKNISDIILDEHGNVIAYHYSERLVEENRYIFSVGRVDTFMHNGNEYEHNFILNKDCDKEFISIIRISNGINETDFSHIPSERYIKDFLDLDK